MPGTVLDSDAHGGRRRRSILYTTEPCGFCRQAKALLEAAASTTSEINLAKDPEGRAELVALTGQMTFPQILVGERAIGGFRELLEADRDGMLEELLDAELERRADPDACEARSAA